MTRQLDYLLRRLEQLKENELIGNVLVIKTCVIIDNLPAHKVTKIRVLIKNIEVQGIIS